MDILWHDIVTSMVLESGGGYIVAWYNNSHGTRERGWIYRGMIWSLPWNQRVGVDISWHDIITPMEPQSGGGYIVAWYDHSHGTREWGWGCGVGVDISWHDIITPMELESGVDILWHDMMTPMEPESGDGYIVAQYNHSNGSRHWGGYIVALYSLPWN